MTVGNITPLAAVSSSAAASSAQSNSRLAKAAREFEGILLGSWLQKIQDCVAGTGDNQDAGHDTLRSMATEAISSAWAGRGGIGLANMLMRQLQPKVEGIKVENPLSGDRNCSPGETH